MEFYVKNENGELVVATQDQILSPDTVLFNKAGEAINRPKSAVDPVEELAGVVKDLALSVSGNSAINDKVDELSQKIATYEAAAKRGFPLPTFDIEGATEEEMKAVYAPFDMAKQGKRLTDKIHHPGYQIPEEKRIEMAKFFTLFFKAAVMRDPAAEVAFRSMYPREISKTAVGDSGNIFPVPDIVDEEILNFAREKSAVLQYARVWEMTSEKQSFPTESAGASVAWGNTTAEGEPTVAEFELSAYELSAYAIVKKMTMADARTDIVSWLTEAMAEAAGLEIDNVAFNGDGSASMAGCNGILSSSCGNSVLMATGSDSIADITDAHYSSMIAELDGLKKQGARFWMHGALLHYVRNLKDTNGKPIFIETVGSPVSGTIWGYPYTEVIKCPSTDAASTAFVAFGNMRYFGVGRRLDATALEVDPYGLFLTNRIRYKIYQRWGLGMALAAGFVRLVTGASS